MIISSTRLAIIWVFARIRIIIINRVFTVSNTTRNQVKISAQAYLRRFIIPRLVIDVIGWSLVLGIQSPSENGNGTQLLCVSEVIGHPNHQLRIWRLLPRVGNTWTIYKHRCMYLDTIWIDSGPNVWINPTTVWYPICLLNHDNLRNNQFENKFKLIKFWCGINNVNTMITPL